MQFEVEVCSQCGLAHIQLTGVVTGMGLHRVMRTFAETGAWSRAQHDVWDLRAVQDLFIRPDEAAMLSAWTARTEASSSSDSSEAASSEGEDTAGLTAFVTRTISQKAYGIVLFQSIHPVSRLRRSFHAEQAAARWLIERTPSVLPAGGENAGTCDADCLLADAVGRLSPLEALQV